MGRCAMHVALEGSKGVLMTRCCLWTRGAAWHDRAVLLLCAVSIVVFMMAMCSGGLQRAGVGFWRCYKVCCVCMQVYILHENL